MSSIEHLEGVFGEGSDWPSPELTLEQDLIDLGWRSTVPPFRARSNLRVLGTRTLTVQQRLEVGISLSWIRAAGEPAANRGPEWVGRAVVG